MSDSQYTPIFNQAVYGAVIGEHNAVTVNVSQPSSPIPSFRIIVGIPPPTDSSVILQRTNEVESIYAKFTENSFNGLVLTGIGGIGKSTLAALVYRYAETDQRLELFTSSPLWLTIDSEVEFKDLAGTIYHSLNQPLPQLDSLSYASQARALCNVLATTKTPRLIVLDQFENFLDWNTGKALTKYPEVGAWIDALNSQPFRKGCRLLLTSRPRPKGNHEYPQIGLHEYLVDSLAVAEGIALLNKQGIQAPEAELQRARDQCNGHPLALILLIALVQDYNMSLTTLLEDPTLWKDDIAINLLDAIFERLNKIQRDLLRNFSVYETPVSLSIIQKQMGAVEYKDVLQALKVLLNHHLMQPIGKDQFQMHIIVAEYVKQHFVETSMQVVERAKETRSVAEETRDAVLAINQDLVQKAQVRAKEYQYRQNLLNRVQTTWIQHFYVPSINDADFIRLALYERPDLIENNDWITHNHEVKRVERQLSAGTSLKQVYDEAEGKILILGEPGSGKTTLLLDLANDLIEQAKLDQELPMPVVFNLSTWTDKHQSLEEWLIEEMYIRYRTPPKLSKPWIENNEILPLLDGLDEVALQYRSACIKAINVFRQKHGQFVSIIVSCRLAEYTEQDEKLALQQAVYIQPMTLSQIYSYWGGEDGQIQRLLRDEPAFQKLAQNPLMLNILKKSYQNKKTHITVNISPMAHRQQIISDYVEFAFRRRSNASLYTPEQAKDWLIWLATRMKQEGKTVFYLEHLQLNWLTDIRSGEIFTSLAFSLLSFPIAVSLFGLEYNSFGLKFALTNGLIVGLLVAIIAFFFVLRIETGFQVAQLLPFHIREMLVNKKTEENTKQAKLNISFISQFFERGGFALFSGLLLGFLVDFLVGPEYALVNGMFLTTFLIVLGKLDKEVHPTEKLVWSFKDLRKNVMESLLIGLGIGVIGGLFNAYPYFQQLNVFMITVFFWLSLGTALGIIIMLMRGYSKDEIDKSKKTVKPNQGIKNSLFNSLRVGLPSGLLLGLVIFFFYSYVIHNVFVVGYLNEIPQDSYIIYSIGVAMAAFYLFWLINGGFACVQHFVLRFLLWRTNHIPWRYSRFLDYAVDRGFLRKVGGGYMFINVLLRDYFVSLGDEKFSAKERTSTLSTEASSLDKFNDNSENKDTSTELHIFVPVLSDTPRLLPCGHKQSSLEAQFCFVCGRPAPLDTPN